MKRTLYFILLLSISFTRSQGQSWQYGKVGGSAQTVGVSQWETTRDVATDKDGNVYLLARVAEGTVHVDGQTKPGNGGLDIALVSYTCNGQLRWWKSIGTPIADEAYSLETDKVGGVYIAVNLYRYSSANAVNIDTDTSFSGQSFKTVYLIKYNTLGVYQWLREPQPDTVSANAISNTGTIDMYVDSAGNIDWLCMLTPGAYASGNYIVNTKGTYMLRYDRFGSFKSGVKLDIDSVTPDNLYFNYDKKQDRYYFCGVNEIIGPNVVFGNVRTTSRKFLAVLDHSGNVIWLREGGDFTQGLFGRPVVDNEGNIYVGGGVRANDTFGSYHTQFTGPYATPFIAKLDSNGNVLWAADAIVNAASVGTGGVALRNSGEVVLHGSFPGLLIWPGAKDTFNVPSNSGYRPFIARFNTQTGKVLGVDQLPTTGTEEGSIVSDGRNNIYIGGYFKSSLDVDGTILSARGGESDFYIAKYGQSNCNCTNIPEPKFSHKIDNQGVHFTYTGSTYSTIKWDFDNGDTSVQKDPNYQYGSYGAYRVCVTVTNDCGDNTYCQVVSHWPTNVQHIGSEGDIQLYPNPAKDVLHVSGITKSTVIIIYDIVGRKVYTTQTEGGDPRVNISQLPQGPYLIQLKGKEGSVARLKFLKE